jgi:glycosyltransferase involved in cell wall biosynthesis
MLALLLPELAGRATVLTVLDAWYLEVETLAERSTGLQRRLHRNSARRVRDYESAAYRGFDRVTVVTDAERDGLQAIDPDMRLAVIPNGVDVDFYGQALADAVDPDRIVFHGVMDYPPNIEAAELLARRVLPRVRQAHPTAHLALVGRAPAAQVRALERLPGVSVTGEVADLRPWLQGSRVSACLMRIGTGIKNKLLEAMAAGVPCVATSLAVRGLEVTPGRELLVGDDEETLARQLVQVLQDDALAARLAAAGRAYVRAKHDWDAVARSYEALYQDALATRRAAT